MRISKFYMLPFCLLVAGAFFLLPSCRNKNTDPEPEVNLVSEHPNDVVYDWNQLFLEIERYAAGYRPGPAPRAIAYLGLADYEACITGMPGYNSISSMYAGLTIPRVEDGKQYHWPSVINACRAYLMPRFFPNATPQQVTDMASLESFYDDRAKQEVGSEVWDRSKEYGKLVASAVWEYSKSDAVGHNHFLDPFQGYKWEDHYSKDGDWKPTFPGPGKPM
ncbi:MAG TPA: hypothetical protein VK168_13035, partial [Saprospiraceae bacterium]|nr:hypothetical protein [Saprospiraceae bacterium]